MTENRNGWPLIERRMRELHLHQKDLAAILAITPSAMSQIKRGLFELNTTQLRILGEFLHFSAGERREFYRALFRARLLAEPFLLSDSGTSVPLLQFEQLTFYDRLSMPLVLFARQRKCGWFKPGDCGGNVALQISDVRLGLPQGTLIVLDTDKALPRHGTALARHESGLIELGELRDGENGERAFVGTGKPPLFWQRELPACPLSWLYPVTLIVWRAKIRPENDRGGC